MKTRVPVLCEVFELTAHMRSGLPRLLWWQLVTDLPAGTEVTLAVERQYDNLDRLLERWTLLEQRITVGRLPGRDLNGAEGEFDIDLGDARALAEFKADPRSPYSGMLNLPSHDIEISCTVGSPQPLPAFGQRNRNLTGPLVRVAGELSVIDESVVVHASFDERFVPTDPERGLPPS